VFGVWRPLPSLSTYVFCLKITISGKSLVTQVTCYFSFNGVDSQDVPVLASETLTLSGKNKKLHQLPLVDGEESKGLYGNKITIQSSEKLIVS
jgi:hypothetical protein